MKTREVYLPDVLNIYLFEFVSGRVLDARNVNVPKYPNLYSFIKYDFQVENTLTIPLNIKHNS